METKVTTEEIQQLQILISRYLSENDQDIQDTYGIDKKCLGLLLKRLSTTKEVTC